MTKVSVETRLTQYESLFSQALSSANSGGQKGEGVKRERKFNTAGPSIAGDHYMIDPLQRINLPEVETLIDDKRYFVLHAPR